MISRFRFNALSIVTTIIAACLLVVLGLPSGASALTPLPTPDPQPGSYGIEATKTKDPPTVGASISSPADGATFSNSPITVNGICPNDLLVQVFDNGVMVGAAMCQDGSFSLQVSLFAGTNDLTVMVYDELDQAGPVSNKVTVTYTDTSFTAFGELVTLTSNYGRRAAPAGSQLSWPLQLSGGSGPYAFSIDWGDGSKPELKSQSLAGTLTIAHTYKKAGIYQLNIRVTDSNDVTAFLQLVAVSSGQVAPGSGTSDGSHTPTVITKILWIPAVIAFLLLGPAFWLGRRSQLVSLRTKMLRDRDSYIRQ